MSGTYGREGVTSQEVRVIALLPISLPASYSQGLQGKEFKMEIKGTARQGQPDCYTLAAQQSLAKMTWFPSAWRAKGRCDRVNAC